MDMDVTPTGADTSDHPGEYTERMAHATSFHNTASNTEASSAMRTGKRHFLSKTISAGTDLTRL
jgi:hypothetical protein